MNADDIERRVRAIFGDQPEVLMGDGNIYDWINEAQIEIARRIDPVRTSATLTYTVGEPLANLPVGFISAFRVTFGTKVLKATSIQELDTLFTNPENSSDGEPTHYYIWGDKLYLYPAPDSVQTLTVLYSGAPTDVSANQKDLGVPVAMHNAVLDYCLARAKELDEDYAGAQMYRGLFEAALGEGSEESHNPSNDTYPSVRLMPEDQYY